MRSNRTLTQRRKLLGLIASIALLGAVGAAQQGDGKIEPRVMTVYDIGHAQHWPHIGAPPREGSDRERSLAWPSESLSFNRALDALRLGWHNEIPRTGDALRLEDRRYEDLVLTVTSAGGFGNLVLADTARRLDLYVLSAYAVLHPSEHATIADILAGRRVHLLSADAAGDMIGEELHMPPPRGRWRLSEGDLDPLLRDNGSTLAQESKWMVLFPPGPAATSAFGSVNFLLYRLAMDDQTLIGCGKTLFWSKNRLSETLKLLIPRSSIDDFGLFSALQNPFSATC